MAITTYQVSHMGAGLSNLSNLIRIGITDSAQALPTLRIAVPIIGNLYGKWNRGDSVDDTREIKEVDLQQCSHDELLELARIVNQLWMIVQCLSESEGRDELERREFSMLDQNLLIESMTLSRGIVNFLSEHSNKVSPDIMKRVRGDLRYSLENLLMMYESLNDSIKSVKKIRFRHMRRRPRLESYL